MSHLAYHAPHRLMVIAKMKRRATISCLLKKEVHDESDTGHYRGVGGDGRLVFTLQGIGILPGSVMTNDIKLNQHTLSISKRGFFR